MRFSVVSPSWSFRKPVLDFNGISALEVYLFLGMYLKTYLAVILFLFTARQYSVGFEVVTVSMVGDPGPHGFQRKSSGDYR